MRFTTFKEITRLEQTLFGLPTVLLAALLAMDHFEKVLLFKFCGILLAFVTARLSGMAFNQWLDAAIDARNPRTSGRVLPTGRASPSTVKRLAWGNGLLFLLICSLLSPLCLILAPFAFAMIAFYPLMKRLHWSCHLFLGAIHGSVPLFAWAALRASLAWPPALLGGALFAWIAANDILYARQDRDFDRASGLHSIPAHFSERATLRVVRLLHAVSLVMLAGLGISLSLGVVYFSFLLALMGGVLFFHVKRLYELPRGFFFWNAGFSSLLLLFTLVERWHALF